MVQLSPIFHRNFISKSESGFDDIEWERKKEENINLTKENKDSIYSTVSFLTNHPV